MPSSPDTHISNNAYIGEAKNWFIWGGKVLEEFKEIPGESILFDLSPDEVALLFFVVGIAIAPSLTIDELNVIANGLFLLAQVLFTIASQRTLINDVIKAQEEEKSKEDKKSVDKLEAEMKKLTDQLNNLQKQIKELRG